MTYDQTRELMELLDNIETHTSIREREKSKGDDTVWSEVAYYSTLVRESKEAIFDMLKANTQ
tara:strand:+ start:441 stop:626 length:186 start_codon:yes stop_codon:yes gene_type:complete